MEKLQRFLVRRGPGDVFIWTERKAQMPDMEEVWALSAPEALKKETMPEPRTVSIDQIERMKKEDLLIFASVKLGINLDAGKNKSELADLVKAEIFTRPLADVPGESNVPLESRPFRDVRDIRAAGAQQHGGDRATVAGTKFNPPGDAVVGPNANQPVRG